METKVEGIAADESEKEGVVVVEEEEEEEIEVVAVTMGDSE